MLPAVVQSDMAQRQTRKNQPRPKAFAKRGLYESFQRAKHALGLKPDEHVLLGLSGGKDSVALLHLLLVQGHAVTAAHLNHKLRGQESLRDEKFVRKLCREWATPLIVDSIDVAAISRKRKLSLEDAARIARYQFFEKSARKKKIRKVLVAHHLNDQAETVLFKVLCGTPASKLRAMRFSAPLPTRFGTKAAPRLSSRSSSSSTQLIRPLLGCSRKEIDLYVRQNRLPHILDSSNQDLKRPRNWIRKRLIPLIERKLDRNVVKSLARVVESSATGPATSN
jgi:tRNA(Ile)-lysidine synthase